MRVEQSAAANRAGRRLLLIRLTVLAENVCPHSSSVIASDLAGRATWSAWTYISETRASKASWTTTCIGSAGSGKQIAGRGTAPRGPVATSAARSSPDPRREAPRAVDTHALKPARAGRYRALTRRSAQPSPSPRASQSSVAGSASFDEVNLRSLAWPDQFSVERRTPWRARFSGLDDNTPLYSGRYSGDLSGYGDGTSNPPVEGGGPGMIGVESPLPGIAWVGACTTRSPGDGRRSRGGRRARTRSWVATADLGARRGGAFYEPLKRSTSG